MPKSSPARLKAQAKYDKKPEVKKARAARNNARRKMIAAGKAHKGDGKDVMHKNGSATMASNSMSNLMMGTKAQNRSFPRTSGAKKKNPRD